MFLVMAIAFYTVSQLLFMVIIQEQKRLEAFYVRQFTIAGKSRILFIYFMALKCQGISIGVP